MRRRGDKAQYVDMVLLYANHPFSQRAPHGTEPGSSMEDWGLLLRELGALTPGLSRGFVVASAKRPARRTREQGFCVQESGTAPGNYWTRRSVYPVRGHGEGRSRHFLQQSLVSSVPQGDKGAQTRGDTRWERQTWQWQWPAWLRVRKLSTGTQ